MNNLQDLLDQLAIPVSKANPVRWVKLERRAVPDPVVRKVNQETRVLVDQLEQLDQVAVVVNLVRLACKEQLVRQDQLEILVCLETKELSEILAELAVLEHLVGEP